MFAEEQGVDYGEDKRFRTKLTTWVGDSDGRRGGNGDGSDGAEAKGYYAHRKPRTIWKPEGGVRSVGDGKDGYPREDGEQIEHRRHEVRRKPR